MSPLLVVLLALPLHAAVLTRGPYLEGVTPRSAYVCWRTDAAGQGALELAPESARRPKLLVEDASVSAQKCLEARGLRAGERYSYRVGWREQDGATVWLASGVLRTADPSGTSKLRFAVIGDTGRATKAQMRIAERLDESDPAFVLHCGDVVYPYGEDKDYDARYFAQYGRFLSRLPIYFGIGNHDYGNESGSERKARARLAEFLSIHRMPSRPDGTPERRTFFSFDWGPAHFVALDTNAAYPIAGAPGLDSTSEQMRWLERDLAASTQPWKFAFFHIPAYTSGRLYAGEELRKSAAPLFERYGVDVVFQGHDHHYERTTPIREGYSSGTGPVYVVAGMGGAPLTPKQGDYPWRRVFFEGYGFVEIAIDGKRLAGRAVSESGVEFDRFELKKR